MEVEAWIGEGLGIVVGCELETTLGLRDWDWTGVGAGCVCVGVGGGGGGARVGAGIVADSLWGSSGIGSEVVAVKLKGIVVNLQFNAYCNTSAIAVSTT